MNNEDSLYVYTYSSIGVSLHTHISCLMEHSVCSLLTAAKGREVFSPPGVCIKPPHQEEVDSGLGMFTSEAVEEREGGISA